MQRHQVVVGYDGSEDASHALDWAIDYAKERGDEIAVRTAVVSLAGEYLLDPALENRMERMTQAMHQAMRRSAKAGVVAEGTVSMAAPGRMLVEQCRDAELLVVGTDRDRGLANALWGSVSRYVTQHSRVPVVVVRAAVSDEPRVVAAVDGSPLSEQVLAFAFDVATYRGWAVEVLHAGERPSSWASYSDEVSGEKAQVEEGETRLLHELVAGWREKYPDVAVHAEIVRGQARQVLPDATRRARLLVLGAHSGFEGWGVLGSTTMHAVQHAQCPVAVVR